MHRMVSIILLGLLLAGCAGDDPSGQDARSTNPGDVLERTWQWESTVTPVETITAAAPERYTILLTEEGNARFQFDCNRGGGDYQISEGRLSFGPMMSTQMACPGDTQDILFMRDLARIESFFLEGGSLFLEIPYDSGTMRFSPAP